MKINFPFFKTIILFVVLIKPLSVSAQNNDDIINLIIDTLYKSYEDFHQYEVWIAGDSEIIKSINKKNRNILLIRTDVKGDFNIKRVKNHAAISIKVSPHLQKHNYVLYLRYVYFKTKRKYRTPFYKNPVVRIIYNYDSLKKQYTITKVDKYLYI